MKPSFSKFKLNPSWGMGAVFLLIHGGAISCLYFIGILGWLKVVITLCILINLIITVRNYVWFNNLSSILAFWPDRKGGGRWYLERRTGEIMEGVISYPVFNSKCLIIIIFTVKSQRLKVTLPIAWDALTVEEFRKLKMVLKTEKPS